MGIESESLGNSVIKPEQLGGKYRGARRDAAVPEQASSDAVAGRVDDQAGAPSQDDLVERDPHDALTRPVEPVPGADRVELRLLGSCEPPTLRPLDLGHLTEPVLPPAGWPESAGDSLVEHPLLRGLLLELPARGAAPAPEWLDHWFEAARAILELLYAQPVGRSR